MVSAPHAERPHWDERFSKPGYYFGTEPNAFLTRVLGLVPGGARVLCVCDGEGRNGTFVASQGYDVTTFDISPVAVEKANALASERGVTMQTHVSAVDTWDWAPDRFDAVVGIFFQFASPELRTHIFESIMGTLRPGGLLLLEGYTPRQLAYGTGGPPLAENMYTQDLLREAFAAHDIVDLVEYDAEISEGPGHEGMSALIDCIVRKR